MPVPTAKRRWSRELGSQVDGIAFGSEGPVLLHGYDPPAGGKWVDDVIPGKLGALDRNTGELLWMAPCEVGYGRGFGAGVGVRGQVLVLGPTTSGHRMVRMAMADGELIDVSEIPAFDEAHVAKDLCLCSAAGRIFAIDSTQMSEVWEYRREGERFHHVSRAGDRALVAFSNRDSGKHGVAILDAETGEFEGLLVEPTLPVIHGIAVTHETCLLLTCDIEPMLQTDQARSRFAIELASHEDEGTTDTLTLVGLRVGGRLGDDPLWHRILETRPTGDLPEVSISADSGKLYLERGAHMSAVDALTGRDLGEWTVPGLDEQIAWSVVQGAGLLAEETRVSLFELPA